MKHIIDEKKLCLLIHGQERKHLEKTWISSLAAICDEIESFSVVGYQAFESQPRTVLNLERIKHIFCI